MATFPTIWKTQSSRRVIRADEGPPRCGPLRLLLRAYYDAGRRGPESLSELLESCRSWIRRYIVVSEDQAVIMATWVLHTYAFDAAETTPYIHITAPEKACGKSCLMEALEALAAAPIRSAG